MKEKIFVETIKNGVVIKRAEIGVAVFDEGRISARKYNELKRKQFASGYIKKGCYQSLVTESGKRDTFGGYPAINMVTFK